MSVLLVDECCGSECAEGDRSLQGERGLLTYSQSMKQTEREKKKKETHIVRGVRMCLCVCARPCMLHNTGKLKDTLQPPQLSLQ